MEKREKEPRVEREPQAAPEVGEGEREEGNLEVESWVTKIEKRLARIPKGAPGPRDDQVVVQQPASGQPPVKLPVSKQAVTKGKRAPIETGLAWLVAWAVRRMKQLARLGRRVILKEIPEVKKNDEG